ncbi:hypothetical protein D0466_20825 [Peribacillus glennii]|uniref:Uncharacterized protein n=1 Tax=Peribacillus glennii TaxID=2303991 RepID=A0A372L6S5_9BACI|nr:hypothetical protein D0466_20825 [Peribacillus glennii]
MIHDIKLLLGVLARVTYLYSEKSFTPMLYIGVCSKFTVSTFLFHEVIVYFFVQPKSSYL